MYQYEDEKPGDNLKAQVEALVKRMDAEKAEIDRLEEALSAAKEAYRKTSESDIPELMDGLRGKLALEDGRYLEIEDVIHGSVPKEKQPFAYDWMDKNGYHGLAKRQIRMEFNLDETAWANKVMADLRKRKKSVRAVMERSVHPQTLLAFIRECVREGVDLPDNLFSVRKYQRAKIRGTASPADDSGE